jgi:hypothetical protein
MKGFNDIYQECFPNNSFEDLNIPLYVTATDILKGELVYFLQEIYLSGVNGFFLYSFNFPTCKLQRQCVCGWWSTQ